MVDFLPPSPYDYSGLDLIRDIRKGVGGLGRPSMPPRPHPLPPSPYDYSLIDLFRDVGRDLGRRDRQHRMRRELGLLGVNTAPGPQVFPFHRDDASKLANLMTDNNPADPQIQARFLTMLKQMGYLPNQAY